MNLDNWAALQQSTGETFASMADRLSAPDFLAGMDPAGRRAHEELAGALRKQKDDPDAVKRHRADPAPAGRKG